MSTIFSAYDIRGRAGETLTVEYAWTAGKALAEWLPEDGVVVVAKSGTDESIAHALIEGVLLQGRNVAVVSGDQQAVIDAINANQAAGGVLISHDGAQGLEVITLFDASGATITAESGLVTIAELIDAGNFLPAAEKGELTTL
jgi:phosphomannomutase